MQKTESTTPDDKPVLTTKDLAERWGMTVEHLEIKRHRGDGPKFFKTGDKPQSPVRYRLEDVLEYEKSRTRQKTNQPK